MGLKGPISVLKNRGPAVFAQSLAHGTRGAYNRRILKRNLITRRVFGHVMTLDLNDQGISRTLLLFGKRELEQRFVLQRVLRPGMVVLDIGANIGYYPLIELELIGPRGFLIAVEPSPANVELLRKNLAANGYTNVLIMEAAVSDELTTRTMYMSAMSNLNTFHPTAGSSLMGAGELQVQTVTIPHLVANTRKPDLIRMDIEGHEVEVLGGALNAIAEGALAPMILFEPHANRYSPKRDMASVLKRLFELGYTTAYIGSSSQHATEIIRSRGYKPITQIKSDDVVRGVFRDITAEDTIDFVTVSGAARTVLLAAADRSP